MSHESTYDGGTQDGGAHGDDERELGVEFGELNHELESIDYPITLDELLSRHGDADLTFGDDDATLRELLEPLGEDEYDSPEEVRDAVLTMVDSDAVGRQRYSDRGGVDAGEDQEEDESF